MVDDAPQDPAIPERSGGPAKTWKHRELYDRVVKALYVLPSEFETDINIVGISVTDLYTFNSALGAAIEQSVVANLNKLRPIWDPDNKYRLYRFVRQAQVFPDVRLQSVVPGDDTDIIMGIELKGWFAMAKEGEPSFRYTVTPAACAPQDLLVVYPWILHEITSGSPMLLRPFVEEARHAAEVRNHYWEISRGKTGPKSKVVIATADKPYPTKGGSFNDQAASDSGGNFGRVSRSGITGDWIGALMQETASGVPLGAWQSFVKIFSEGQTAEGIDKKIASLRSAFPAEAESAQAQSINAILDALEGLSDSEAPSR